MPHPPRRSCRIPRAAALTRPAGVCSAPPFSPGFGIAKMTHSDYQGAAQTELRHSQWRLHAISNPSPQTAHPVSPNACCMSARACDTPLRSKHRAAGKRPFRADADDATVPPTYRILKPQQTFIALCPGTQMRAYREITDLPIRTHIHTHTSRFWPNTDECLMMIVSRQEWALPRTAQPPKFEP